MNETERLLYEAKRACDREDWGFVIQSTDEVLKRRPDCDDALFLAGLAFMKCGNEGMAVQMFNTARAATTVPGKLAAIWNNLGCCLKDYQHEDAYKAFLKALSYGGTEETFYNLTTTASQIGRHSEALEWAAKSQEKFGRDASHNAAFALFALGRWAEAWECFDKSFAKRDLADRSYGLPRWKGPNGGQRKGRVIVHGEQGIGDEIMFLSLLPKDFDGVIECNPRNETLVARSFPKASVYGTLNLRELDWVAKEACDYEIEMGGLGRFYAPRPFSGPAFLAADPAREAAWREWLQRSCPEGFRGDDNWSGGFVRQRQFDPDMVERQRRYRGVVVGVAWTGGSWSTGRAQRSIPFEVISRLFDIPGVTFVNLEYDNRRDELKPFPQVLNPYWATKKGADMDDLAALIAALDLVIAPTTSVVDLAGALGKECWAMVDAYPPWRYSDAAGDDRMWFYDSVRVFRQQVRDNRRWERVVGEIRRALSERFALEAAA